MTGLSEFKQLLEEFQKLSIWAAGGSVALPFIASFMSVIPPWPAGLNLMTAVFQLMVLMLVYQRYKGRSKAVFTRGITVLFVFSFLIFVVYIAAFSMFTIYVPLSDKSIVIGYECTQNAKMIYEAACPFLSLDTLAAAAYDEFLLWSKASIAIIRATLITLWFLFFICLAGLIGKFLVYQMKRRVPEPGRKARGESAA